MTPSDDREVFRLPEVLDVAAATPLRAELLSRRGHDLALDGSEVRKLGGLCLQVLCSAQATWSADARDLSLRSPSEALSEALVLLGAPSLMAGENVEIGK